MVIQCPEDSEQILRALIDGPLEQSNFVESIERVGVDYATARYPLSALE